MILSLVTLMQYYSPCILLEATLYPVTDTITVPVQKESSYPQNKVHVTMFVLDSECNRICPRVQTHSARAVVARTAYFGPV